MTDNSDLKRSATDILLDIESKIGIFNQRMSNLENLIKILLNKINKENYNRSGIDTPSKFVQMAREKGVEIEELDGNKEQRIMIENDLNPQPEPPPKRKKGKRSFNKISVSQKIMISESNQPLFLASIEISDKDGNLINQTRTNQVGKWISTLSPGEYNVSLRKRFNPSLDKETINKNYTITVPNNSEKKVIELEEFFV